MINCFTVCVETGSIPSTKNGTYARNKARHNGIRYHHITKPKYILRGYEAFSLIDINRLIYYSTASLI